MGSYEVKVNLERRTLYVRASGTMDLSMAQKILVDYKKETDKLKGKKHFVVADLRGLLAMTPDVATIFGETIAYGRAKGAVRCAHLSDTSIARLQTRRLAREITPGDKITVDVLSEEEAERLIDEEFRKLD